MSIHIVTHCYAVEKPQYAVFLRAQLSSLVSCSCSVPVKISVVCSLADERTCSVVSDFMNMNEVCIEIEPAEGCDLFKRAIMRNQLALRAKYELMWFADADYYFGGGCLTSLWNQYVSCENKEKYESENVCLIWPTFSRIHINHEIGDKFWKNNLNSIGIIDLDLDSNFGRVKYIKAIGGLQISPRWYVSTFGYLDGTKWTQPEDKVTQFRNTREDVKFRKRCLQHGENLPVFLPNLYRFRHTEHGWPEP